LHFHHFDDIISLEVVIDNTKGDTTMTIATNTYYFPQRTITGAFLVHFGDENRSLPVSGRNYYSYNAAEMAAQRMNEQAGLVAPVDEDYSLDEEEGD
jgi:hypothetical protein